MAVLRLNAGRFSSFVVRFHAFSSFDLVKNTSSMHLQLQIHKESGIGVVVIRTAKSNLLDAVAFSASSSGYRGIAQRPARCTHSNWPVHQNQLIKKRSGGGNCTSRA